MHDASKRLRGIGIPRNGKMGFVSSKMVAKSNENAAMKRTRRLQEIRLAISNIHGESSYALERVEIGAASSYSSSPPKWCMNMLEQSGDRCNGSVKD
jgi:hypothetical protein